MNGSGWMATSIGDESVWIEVEEPSAVAGVRRRTVAMAARLGFAPERLAQAGLLASELASNLCKHARKGVLVLRVVRDETGAALEFVCMDAGPGMTDVAASMRDGYSTSGTLGIGLGAIDRLSGGSETYSVVGRGTVLVARFPAGPGPAPQPAHAGLTRPIDGEDECGDAYAVWAGQGQIYAMLCDGLGHGPLAAAASREAVRIVREMAPASGPVEIVERIHRGLRHTRGGAVAAVAVETGSGRTRFAGLGNVAGWLVGPDRRRGMASTPGIAGHNPRRLREQVFEPEPGEMVVLHSDGLTDRWRLDGHPGLLTRVPLLVAATLMREAGVRHDDRAVVVLRAAA